MRLPVALAGRPGVRSGLLVLLASFAGHAGNYLYYVVAARMTGVEQFAEISAMIGLATIAFMPFNGLQVAAARDVARMTAVRDAGGVSGYVRSLLRRTGSVVVPGVLVLAAASPFLTSWLKLETSWLVILTAVWIALGSTLIVVTGVVQGQQRFGLVAAVLAGPLGLLRVVLLAPALLAVGLSGSILAMVLAAVLGLVLVAGPLRAAAAPAPDRSTLFRPGQAVVALLAFSSLTNLDLLVAKAALPAAEAGAYSGAVLLGKIALFAPGALALVLLPRAAALLAEGRSADRTVLATVAVTAASGLAVAGLLVLPVNPVALTFGDDFTGGASLLGPLALIMTAAAVLNVHLTFAMARSSRGFSTLLASAAVLHALLLAVLHDSAAQVVTANALAVVGSLVIHEVGSRHGALRMTGHLRRQRSRA